MPDFLPHAGMALGPLLALVVLVCVIEATLVLGTLAPGEIVLVLAAGIVDFRYLPFVVAAAALGSFIGQYLGFELGRRSGHRIRSSGLGRRLGEHRWQRGERVMRNADATTMIAVRFIAFGHTLAPVVAGALHMERRRFVRLTAIASGVWSIVWVTVGVVAGSAGAAVDNPVVTFALATVGVLVAGAALTRMTRRVGDDPAATAAGSTPLVSVERPEPVQPNAAAGLPVSVGVAAAAVGSIASDGSSTRPTGSTGAAVVASAGAVGAAALAGVTDLSERAGQPGSPTDTEPPEDQELIAA